MSWLVRCATRCVVVYTPQPSMTKNASNEIRYLSAEMYFQNIHKTGKGFPSDSLRTELPPTRQQIRPSRQPAQITETVNHPKMRGRYPEVADSNTLTEVGPAKTLHIEYRHTRPLSESKMCPIS